MRKELLLPEMVQLMEHYPTTIKRFGLRKFCSAAFYLMVKLSSGETQERSRGQVLAGNKHDIKPVLDAVIISACKGYVWMWCKDHSKTAPDDTSFNKAVTLQIDYSRK
ncbi:hypothetical protein DPMN_063245 [Dreissena polymorpha]|uniref:Uncharacterized protein n=1 Tax=Dreissena polymorpha TaxID=45954 RepID=A0A9D4HK20_DREPO|nr:hypothetical protein DPMN_063245 [Dreissena polymorpha]